MAALCISRRIAILADISTIILFTSSSEQQQARAACFLPKKKLESKQSQKRTEELQSMWVRESLAASRRDWGAFSRAQQASRGVSSICEQ